ncbi:hypothetical protein [Prosthecobacter sp.]|uniref:hypothetical protein n=1 Tax=Prosthecobacter sp. TaxID=1965333 RepID=UPI003784BA07
MASKAGIFDIQFLAPDAALHPQHNVQSSAPGLPVKASEIIYAGCLVGWDPANSQACSADPTMAATAKVIGAAVETIDNRTGAKGDLKISPRAGVMRVKNDGNITAAHLYTTARVVDDHTVGVPAGTDADRPAGLIVGLDGSDYVWLLVLPESAKRGPLTVTLTSTNGTFAAAADLAAAKAEGEKVGDDVRAIHAALVTAGIIAPAA